ncbi:L-cysteine:1D-myo-inositol 2-amino-2-deoxy-alpha-D-glucopyranoside ligase [Micrococcales bacterium KH10]|nr:L-cysteine:1D-myo-inositol 2-amino-2-deoxy-alpha-D-glucopyranoside ligase [Micrococcales bacterium KH10]
MLAWPNPTIPQIPDSTARVKQPYLFDSTTERLQPLLPADATEAGIYVCGVTPYDATHIGHAATYIAFDVLIRTWRDYGVAVTYASNVTDVDDPLLERAKVTGQEWEDLAAEQTDLFTRDMTALSVIAPDVYVSATESIPRVVTAVTTLLEAGRAYLVPVDPADPTAIAGTSDIYADLSATPGGTAVFDIDRDTATALFARRGGDPQRSGKRDALDPLLWRAQRHGEPNWDGGDLGRGRPGWHIECAVIARDGLGTQWAVQGGGQDLIFPHHTMSTLHARALPDDAGRVSERFGAQHHVHAGLVSYQGEKMSKSLGNLVLVSRLLATGVEPAAIRVAVLGHHYRSEWEWFDDDLKTAQERITRWRKALSGYEGADPMAFLDEVRSAVRDDLDTPRALAAMDDWAQQTLTAVYAGEQATSGAAGIVSRTLSALLGIDL